MIIKNQACDGIASVESEKLFDLSMLYELDDNRYVAQILTIFLRETPQELQQIKKAVETRNFKVVCSTAHKLKSSAGILGANGLFVLLDEIEGMSKAGSITEELTWKVENAEGEFKKIQSSLQSVLKGLQ